MVNDSEGCSGVISSTPVTVHVQQVGQIIMLGSSKTCPGLSVNQGANHNSVYRKEKVGLACKTPVAIVYLWSFRHIAISQSRMPSSLLAMVTTIKLNQ